MHLYAKYVVYVAHIHNNRRVMWLENLILELYIT
jgi:hypothetical protein